MNVTNNAKNTMNVLGTFVSLNKLEHQISFPQMVPYVEFDFYIHHIPTTSLKNEDKTLKRNDTRGIKCIPNTVFLQIKIEMVKEIIRKGTFD